MIVRREAFFNREAGLKRLHELCSRGKVWGNGYGFICEQGLPYGPYFLMKYEVNK